jgi:16S rRNA (cytosine1402-N4)-methyltransferase
MITLYHNPVLLNPSVDGLLPGATGVWVDVTFGGGGHSRALLNKIGVEARLVAFDQDPDAALNRIIDNRFTLIPKNFRNLKASLAEIGIHQVDGILADLGVSSHQFDAASRGFSYRFEAHLDMRMDPSQAFTAADLLATYPRAELTRVFRELGELPKAWEVAGDIETWRKHKPIEMVRDLEQAVVRQMPHTDRYSWLSRLYQALRIEVNDEINALRALLEQGQEVLKEGGRMAVISYHSLEDRLVKYHFSTGNFEGVHHKDFFGNPLTPWRGISRKPIMPDEHELQANPRSRSARLRIAEKNTEIIDNQ